MEGTFAIIGVFGIIPLIVWIVAHNRAKAQVSTADLVKTMVEKDKEITPEIIKAIGYVPARRHKDLRTGLILLATGLAFLLMSRVIPEHDEPEIMAGIAAFPVLIGIAFLIFWYFISRKDED